MISTKRLCAKGQQGAGWNVYTRFYGMRVNKDGATSPITFTSTSSGGRFAVEAPYRRWEAGKRRQMPVCSLHSRERNDEYGNHNPVFKIETWVPASRFMPADDLLQIESKPEAAKPAEAPMRGAIDPTATEVGRLSKIIDDKLPF